MDTKLLKIAAFGSLLLSGTAAAYSIDDNYIGGDAAWDRGSWYKDRPDYAVDVIGSSSVYDVFGMDISVVDDFLQFTIHSNYSDDRSSTTTYGDLFISIDGWNPGGSADDGYLGDNAFTGEDWEFVFDTSENTLYGGDFDIGLTNTEYNLTNYIYRSNQEVLRTGGGTSYAGDGSFVDLSNAGYHGTITYNISLASLGNPTGELGVHWNMLCGNDTIEGAFTVSEPGTLALLSLGMFGVVGLRRRKSEASKMA